MEVLVSPLADRRDKTVFHLFADASVSLTLVSHTFGRALAKNFLGYLSTVGTRGTSTT